MASPSNLKTLSYHTFPFYVKLVVDCLSINFNNITNLYVENSLAIYYFEMTLNSYHDDIVYIFTICTSFTFLVNGRQFMLMVVA